MEKLIFSKLISWLWQRNPLPKSLHGWPTHIERLCLKLLGPFNGLNSPRWLLHSLSFFSYFEKSYLSVSSSISMNQELFLQLSESLGATQAYKPKRLWFTGCFCAACWTWGTGRRGEIQWALDCYFWTGIKSLRTAQNSIFYTSKI